MYSLFNDFSFISDDKSDSALILHQLKSSFEV